MKPWLAAALQVAGAVVVTVGAFLLAAWLGWIVGGAFLMAIGVAVERGDR